MKSKIKSLAESIGFDLFGVADINDDTLTECISYYEGWISAGNQASMGYLEKHLSKKKNPKAILPDSKSVICLGSIYYKEPSENANDKPKISKYTEVEDYHEVLKEKLLPLTDFIESVGEKSYSFVDAQPVFERYWAWRAGLGWIGKNTCLISKKEGSYFFLCGIITTLRLEPDNVGLDHCGKCNKCIEACPTQAIVLNRFIETKNKMELYNIDSRKCIGYHTIENKHEIPVEIMQNMGEWVAGCDICQQVCPWNDPPTVAKNTFYLKSNALSQMSYSELSKLTLTKYKTLLNNFSMSRSKYIPFMRNLVISIVNSSYDTSKKRSLLSNVKNTIQSQSLICDDDQISGFEKSVGWAQSKLER